MVGKAICAMIEYFGTDRIRIGQAFRVHCLARAMALQERLEPDRMQLLECAAILQGIGAPESIRLFGCARAEHLEIVGARVAGELLRSLHFPIEAVDRIAFLIRHHRSGSPEGGAAGQILLEAVTIAALDDGSIPERPSPLAMEERLFRTKTGRELLHTMFGILPSAVLRQPPS